MVAMAKRDSSKLCKPDKIPAKWRKILLQIPGYNSIKTAGQDHLFDVEAAQLMLEFFPEMLKHVEGKVADKPFVLEPWQQAIVANLFGWRRKGDVGGGLVRRYRQCLIYVPRKNGKTPLAAGLGLACLFCDDEAGQQGYIAAAKREQAGFLFRHAKGMVEREPELDGRCRIYGGHAEAGQSRSIVLQEEGSYLRVISADAGGQHGGNTSLAIIDELHAQPNRELVDVLSTSMASANRRQPLTIYLTTADYARESICNEIYHKACRVRDGQDDPTFLPVVYEATAEDDWTSPATWAKANPNLGISVSEQYLQHEAKEAQDNPAIENLFKRLHLNLQTEQDVRAIPMDKWAACAKDITDPMAWRMATIQRLRRADCFGGLDLGSVSDLTCLVLAFKADAPKKVLLLPYFWVPRTGARIRSRRDRVPYETWIAQGWIAGTDGDTTDYDQVRREIAGGTDPEGNKLPGVADIFALRCLRVDRTFQGAQLCTQLMQDGLDVKSFGQGMLSMAGPVRDFLEMIVGCQLDHGNNPVMNWMAANASTETDAAGNLKWSKKKSSEKIDGIVAGTMAADGMNQVGDYFSGYEDPDMPV